MSFTYNLATSGDELLISKVRLTIGDTTEDTGIKPDGTNFTDEEILVKLDDADNDVNTAASMLCDILANAYASVVTIAVGPRRQSLSDISKAYQRRAVALKQHSRRSFSVGVIPKDGYSDDIASDAVEATGSDYQ